MNIFATHPDPVVSAQEHCDRHLVKMILETAQLLSTAHVVATGVQVAYKKTHANHPCAIWVRTSQQNYLWAFNFLCALLDEYHFRFGRTHKTDAHKKALSEIPPLPDIGLTEFAQAMPEHFRSDDAHISYQDYLRAKLTEWCHRPKSLRVQFTRRAIPCYLMFIDATVWHVPRPHT